MITGKVLITEMTITKAQACSKCISKQKRIGMRHVGIIGHPTEFNNMCTMINVRDELFNA